MLRRLLISFATISTIVCAGASADSRVQRKVDAVALKMKPVEWKKSSTAALWPATAKHIQVIAVDGAARGERYVFVVSDGARLLAVYRATGDAALDLHNRIGSTARPTVNSPTVDWSNGGQGIIIGPPPPPPDGPIGWPERFMTAIMNHAAGMNELSLQLESDLAAQKR